MNDNLILRTDSYKLSHFKQYPPGATRVSSYIEARSNSAYETVLFFGLQGFLKDVLSTRVFGQDIDEADEFAKGHGLPFNRAGWERVHRFHDGSLPIRIEAVKEGSVLPIRTPLVQVVNTDPELPWLTSYVETMLLRAVWYPSTVATRSKSIHGLIKRYLERTCDDPDPVLPFRLHDFGARGVSSAESAAIGGAAHLVNFMGSDTIEGIMYAHAYYDEPMAGFSIPAAEHSTITAWGREREREAYANMLTQFGGPGKLVAVVSDSYDIEEAVVRGWGGALKDQVLAMGGTVVVRPDSGPLMTPVKVVQWLAESYGTKTNRKGYKVLHPAVRVIQGDGVEYGSINQILHQLEREGFSAENIAFGMGGKLLQALDRDTLGFAMKASAVEIDGQWRDVFKAPAGDPQKASKRGRLAVLETGEAIRVEDLDGRRNLLEPVWENGELLREQTFADVRKVAASG
jgi:nicotinamide phosphoribosyltransferase